MNQNRSSAVAEAAGEQKVLVSVFLEGSGAGHPLPAYAGILTWNFMLQRDTGVVNHVLVDNLGLMSDRPFWLLGGLGIDQAVRLQAKQEGAETVDARVRAILDRGRLDTVAGLVGERVGPARVGQEHFVSGVALHAVEPAAVHGHDGASRLEHRLQAGRRSMPAKRPAHEAVWISSPSFCGRMIASAAAVVVDDDEDDELLGIYRGVARTERSRSARSAGVGSGVPSSMWA